MSRCTTTLPGVALHPFYDRGSVGIPGFTPTPFETRVQDCADLGAGGAATARRGAGGEGELWATLPTADGGARGRGVWMRQLALGAALTAATVLCRCVLRPRVS